MTERPAAQPEPEAQPAAWRNDPYGRYQLRWWDGLRWTEHVATGGRQQVDPLGASPVIPFVIPRTADPSQ